MKKVLAAVALLLVGCGRTSNASDTATLPSYVPAQYFSNELRAQSEGNKTMQDIAKQSLALSQECSQSSPGMSPTEPLADSKMELLRSCDERYRALNAEMQREKAAMFQATLQFFTGVAEIERHCGRLDSSRAIESSVQSIVQGVTGLDMAQALAGGERVKNDIKVRHLHIDCEAVKTMHSKVVTGATKAEKNLAGLANGQ